MLFWTCVNLCLSILLILKIRKFVMTFYLVVNYILFVQPCVIELLTGATHPRHGLDAEIYETALVFIAIFNGLVGISFLFFYKYFRLLRSVRRYLTSNQIDRVANLGPLIVSAVIIIFIAIGAKVALASFGSFRMLGDVERSPFLQILKVVGTFDLFLLILLGEIRASWTGRKSVLTIFYFILASVALVMAFLSGSRAQLVIVLLCVAISYREFIRRYFLLVGAALVFAIPFMFVVFPFIAYYRNSGYQLEEAVDKLGGYWTETNAIMLDVVTTRLNYMETFAHAMDYANKFGAGGGAVYLNNILGLIPRLLWADKPEISNESREIGHMLGLVTANDTATSIGLRVIGEAYFELAWLGLLVAVVQGLMLGFVQRQFGHKSSPVFYSIYIYTVIYLESRDGYFAVLPGLVYVTIGWILLLAIMALFLQRPRRYYPAPIRQLSR